MLEHSPTLPAGRRLRRFAVRHLVPVAAVALMVLPLVFMITGSLRAPGSVPTVGVELLPSDPTLESYRRLDDFLPMTTFLRNSVIVAVLAVPLTVVVGSLAGFGIRLLTRPGARRVVIVTVILMLIPVTAVWATRFQLFRVAGLTDGFVPLIALGLMATNPFYVLVYAWAFGRVSDEQLDAGRLDGASNLGLWWRIALPQVRVATLAVLVLSFTFHWSNFIDPLLYLSSIDRFTLPLGLRFLQQLNPTDWPLLMAGSVMVSIPVLLLLLGAQRVLFDDPRRLLGGDEP
ncbi:MAG: carbohydrate ABC transporter permease [Actinobacteria bacterium]|nr:carbohydrate ABC transporter permease [Actinomycetota bacterium]